MTKQIRRLMELKNLSKLSSIRDELGNTFTYDENIHNKEENNMYKPKDDPDFENQVHIVLANSDRDIKSVFTCCAPIDYLVNNIERFEKVLKSYYEGKDWIADFIKLSEDTIRFEIPTDSFCENITKDIIIAKYKIPHLGYLDLKYNIVYHVKKEGNTYHVSELFCENPLF